MKINGIELLCSGNIDHCEICPWYSEKCPRWNEDVVGISANGTPVFSDPGTHPHRPELAAEAIAKMVIPATPADPTDRNQTRHAETVDLGRQIGLNHRIKRTPDMKCFMMRRADDKGKLRDWFSIMTLEGEAKPETKITSVCFWDSKNNRWVLWTNHEGEEDLWPEPGTARFNHLSPEEQEKARRWHIEDVLKCTEAEELQCLRTVTRPAPAIIKGYCVEYCDFHGGIQQPYLDNKEFYYEFEAKQFVKDFEEYCERFGVIPYTNIIELH